MAEEEKKRSNNRVLVIGATGKLGYHIAIASIRSSHPTFALIRPTPTPTPTPPHSSSESKSSPRSLKLHSLTDAGVHLLKGSLDDEESLVEAVNQVDVVICAIPSRNVLHQKLLIQVIKRAASSIKRFVPSEFGLDPDKVQISGMDHSFYTRKAEIRRLVEAEGIPYTYISCNFFMSYLLPSLVQPGLSAPPRGKVTVFGDGSIKGVFVKDIDVAAYTINAVDDPRTLNKVLYLRPPGNVYSMNKLIDLWETKIGKQLDRTYVSEEELLKKIEACSDRLAGGCGGSLEEAMALKSKVLVIGGTGYIGKFIVEASAKAGHPTFALVRESTVSDPSPAKASIFHNFHDLGVSLLFGDMSDHDSLVRAIKQVDVVISTVSRHLLADQVKIIAAIKESGNIKRFLPSEFGNDVDRVHAVGPAKTVYAIKAQIRRAIEAEGIPFTYVSSNFFAGLYLCNLSQPGADAPPRDKVVILGDGNPKVVFNKEEDVAAYAIRSIDDPRTLNKILYVRPPGNTYSFNDLVSLWEKKIGTKIERVYVPEEEVLKNIEGAAFPLNVTLSLAHSALVRGDHTNFEIDPSCGVEASTLYPDIRYTSLDEYLDQFV